ncbi:unnamed protein product [Fraxinus pennsylvanica]|uniref:Uncharacterized protein n=1 Tax=Fraxinus pennsylvanica TaxID=56036 RepID=A0AAD2DTR1_9LAMI|nr:unnamed protein product [Fraxinus pennsylvanica]
MAYKYPCFQLPSPNCGNNEELLHCNKENSRRNCCQALAAAVRSENESTACIVSRILFLDSYFYSEDKDSWNWPNGVKMHVLGSLILQSIFRLPNDFILEYIYSITSLEDNHVLEASKDPGGARVIEAFLNSNASTKHKRKLVINNFIDMKVHQAPNILSTLPMRSNSKMVLHTPNRNPAEFSIPDPQNKFTICAMSAFCANYPSSFPDIYKLICKPSFQIINLKPFGSRV